MKELQQAFEGFSQTVNLDHQAMHRVKQLQQAIHDLLQTNLNGLMTQLFPRINGAYRKKTATAASIHIDMFAVFDPEFARNLGPNSLMKTVETALRANNIQTKTKTHSINAKFGQDFVDLVPAHPAIDHESETLLIPEIIASKNPRWTRINPLKNEEILAKYDNLSKKNLIPTIRMLKVWNKTSTECCFSSFHLESIILEIWKQQNISTASYLEIMSRIFQNLSPYVEKKIPEPANVGSELVAPDGKRACLKTRVHVTVPILDKVAVYSQSNNLLLATKELRKIFGISFPQY